MPQDLQQLLAELHPLERKALRSLQGKPSLWDHELQEAAGLDESRLSMALGWLVSKELVTVQEEISTAYITGTDLGQKYAKVGIPEARILKRLEGGGEVGVRDLSRFDEMDSSEISTAVGNLKSFQVIRIAQGGRLEATGANLPPMIDGVLVGLLVRLSRESGPVPFDSLSGKEQALMNETLERKWKTRGVLKRTEKRSRRYALTDSGLRLVERLSTGAGDEEEIGQLTPDLLRDGSWREKPFRKYNIALNPSRMAGGRKHPYREFLDRVKGNLVAMGFEEMRGPLVESEFWNSDALYMPQFHPARDIHDVYFVKHPRLVPSLPVPQANQVSMTHEKGWKTGSRGWRYPFDMERAKRLVLRSQGTSVSARKLAGSPKIPGRYFSMARCFRYDLVDATHAPDFFQVEGIALGSGITFRTLLGLLGLFATELARAPEVKFLPAYFPYTEPSVEMHVQHPKLGWMELGGAGLFRPEVTGPLGVQCPVIAWGLGLDRMAMVALGIQDIRDLFSADLDLIRTGRARG
jgi:phenylalanyl-tRNA synthetase alpha chain